MSIAPRIAIRRWDVGDRCDVDEGDEDDHAPSLLVSFTAGAVARCDGRDSRRFVRTSPLGSVRPFVLRSPSELPLLSILHTHAPQHNAA